MIDPKKEQIESQQKEIARLKELVEKLQSKITEQKELI